MSDQNPTPGTDPQRYGASGSPAGGWSSTAQPGSTPDYPDPGTTESGSDPQVAATDTGPAAGSWSGDDVALGSESDESGTPAGSYAGSVGYSAGAGSSASGSYGSTSEGGAADKAKEVAGQAKDVAGNAAEQAGELKDAAVAKAAEVKDVAVERGAEVAAVAKDEIARLAGEARSQVQDLWSQASGQLREQADAGRHQLADLLHNLAGELGEMASKSTQSGPVTALAKQAAARGGELSHWLANSDSSDFLTELKRFARRRPVVFLGGAALAGVLVGRLGRGLMAVSETDKAAASLTAGSPAGYGSVPATAGVTATPPVSLSEVPDFGSGEAPVEPYGYSSEGGSAQQLTDGPGSGGLR